MTSPGNTEDDIFDVDIQIDAEDNMIPTAILAVSAAPTDTVVVSLSYQLPYDVNASGTADVTLSDVYVDRLGASVTGEKRRLSSSASRRKTWLIWGRSNSIRVFP